MKIEIVVSTTNQGAIGVGSELLYESPLDLKMFRDLTINKPCLMGSTTYRQIFKKLGHPLTNRHSIVLSKVRPSLYVKTFDTETWVPSLEDAFAVYRKLGLKDKSGQPYPLMVIGGESVYNQLLPLAHRVHLTRFHIDLDGDYHFPPLDETWDHHYQKPLMEDNTLITFNRYTKIKPD
jgi:dihydrofolate reductase